MRIVVAEHPKSGGTWIVSLLADTLGLPKRDIYISDGYSHFDVAKHPWFAGAKSWNMTNSCVIKSHELPNSPLAAFPACFLHLARDGRDVVLSKYYYEKDFCVANGVYKEFNEPFEHYLRRVAAEWRTFVMGWLDAQPRVHKYESFLHDPAGSLKAMLAEVGMEADDCRVQAAIEANTPEKIARSLDAAFPANTFVRKATSGYWRTSLTAEQAEIFKGIAGDALIRLGYEDGLNWTI